MGITHPNQFSSSKGREFDIEVRFKNFLFLGVLLPIALDPGNNEKVQSETNMKWARSKVSTFSPTESLSGEVSNMEREH